MLQNIDLTDQSKLQNILINLILLKSYLCELKYDVLIPIKRVNFSRFFKSPKIISQLINFGVIILQIRNVFKVLLDNFKSDKTYEVHKFVPGAEENIAKKCIQKISQQCYLRSQLIQHFEGNLDEEELRLKLRVHGFGINEIDKILEEMMDQVQTQIQKNSLDQNQQLISYKELEHSANIPLKQKKLSSLIEADLHQIYEIKQNLMNDQSLIDSFYQLLYFDHELVETPLIKQTLKVINVSDSDHDFLLQKSELTLQELCQLLQIIESKKKTLRIQFYKSDDYNFKESMAYLDIQNENLTVPVIIDSQSLEEIYGLQTSIADTQFEISKSNYDASFQYKCIGIKKPSFYKIKKHKHFLLSQGLMITLAGTVNLYVKECLSKKQSKGKIPCIEVILMIYGNQLLSRKLADNCRPVKIGTQVKDSYDIFVQKELLQPSHQRVSRVHCEIGQNEQGYWYVKDLGSTFGTFISCQSCEVYDMRQQLLEIQKKQNDTNQPIPPKDFLNKYDSTRSFSSDYSASTICDDDADHINAYKKDISEKYLRIDKKQKFLMQDIRVKMIVI
ncbi:UNKNOWN [Stylonychia lemnae]|uniref:FHA domain-containing protein n=1 Tax=Stylonychia lemnae TaxID=5949 RepID=A0A078AC71_STYLE|nr:UNKNOWN [Stylonychia lemnae]|eukprot:CDW79202.1 UNKNOWN [Stylonychia lemnae]